MTQQKILDFTNI